MSDYLLILNAGSSSLKFCVFQISKEEDWEFIIKGQIEGIGTSPTLLAKNHEGKPLANQKLEPRVTDCQMALEVLSVWLRSQFPNAHLRGVGHRVVHGGTKYFAPVKVTPDVLEELKALEPLAPLHQPHNLAAIEAVFQRLPDVEQVACFDTAFHHGHEAMTDIVPLPIEYRKQGIQRYGFHGLSYEYICSVLPAEIKQGRVIVAHLGSGASLCAIREGRSIDSTFGFTALDGLCMGTRPGALDPGVVLYLFQNLKLSPKEVESLLYKKSGLLGISGFSNDMRDLIDRNDPAAILAVDYFIYRAAKEIGALTAVLNGLDGLVFTAGIGENSPEIRKRICEASSWLGITLNQKANENKETKISDSMSKVSVWMIPTNEELMIARHTRRLLR